MILYLPPGLYSNQGNSKQGLALASQYRYEIDEASCTYIIRTMQVRVIYTNYKYNIHISTIYAIKSK